MGELEVLLVDKIIAATWRLRRLGRGLGRVEAGIFAFELYGELAERARSEARSYTRTETPYDDLVGQYATKTIMTDEHKHQVAM